MNMFRHTSLCALALCITAAAAPAQDLYDTTVLRNLSFQFHDANWWTLLQQNYSSQTHILADLTVEDVTYPDVGVRIRGSSSYTMLPPGSEKVSLRVKMDLVHLAQTLMGYGTINLNNSYGDPTFCREVAYQNILAEHMPAGRANHVTVSLNGANWGVYANIQQWNRELLRDWFEDETGLRIKVPSNSVGPGLSYVGSDPLNYTSDYEIKGGGGLAAPWGALISICNVVTNGSTSNWEQSIDEFVAIDPSIRAVVLENLYGDVDSYINKGSDFVVYRDPLDGRAHIQQTDANETFRADNWSATHGFGDSNKPFLSHVLSVPELRQRYMAHLRSVLQGFTWTNLDQQLSAYRNLIDAAVQADPKKLYSYQDYQTNFTNTVSIGGSTVIGIQEFVTQRGVLVNQNAEVSAQGPQISSVAHSPAFPNPGESTWVTAQVDTSGGVVGVQLHYRLTPGRFLATPMFDDGGHSDGVAGDGVYGAQVPVNGTGGQKVAYYVSAEATNTYGSLSFSPQNPEIMPHELSFSYGPSGIRITEYLYFGADGEFIEFTNTSAASINMTGWSYDDNSATPGTIDLSAAGILAPGESVVLTDVDQASFMAAWGLSGVTVIDGNLAAGLARNDQINVFDANDQLVERLDFGDEQYVGSIRAQHQSGKFCAESLGDNDIYSWTLSEVGDAWGSWASAGGSVGSPGSYTGVNCDPTLGTNYCVVNQNESGTQATISALGSGTVADQDITLQVADANPSKPGLFFYGTGALQVPLDNGFLCAAAPHVRITPVLVADSSGAASLSLDFQDPYASGLVAGNTLYLQFWYRDAGTSNLSDGLLIPLN